MKIISPSYKRAKTVKTHKLIESINYAVHEFEADEYRKEGFEVIVLPDSTRGNIPNVRNWLLDQNIRNEILFIDDDIESFNYWDNCKQIKIDGERLLDHIGMMLELAEKQADAMKDKMIDELGSEDMASKIASAINKKIDIPFVSEEKEQIFFEKCVDVVTDIIEGMFKK